MRNKKEYTFALAVMAIALVPSFSSYAAEQSQNKTFMDYYSGSYASVEDVVDAVDEEVSDWEGKLEAVTGPAIKKIKEEQRGLGDGPVINELTLAGQYHEEYDVYELSMDNKYFLYSNVDNGGITDKIVYVEIPQGLMYSMEKDGNPIHYTSGQKVGEHGTYVLNLTAVKDTTVPMYRQEEYRAIFRFRIQDKAPVSETGEDGSFTGPGPKSLSDLETGLKTGLNHVSEGMPSGDELAGMIPVDENTLFPQESESTTDQDMTAEETVSEETVSETAASEGTSTAQKREKQKHTQVYDIQNQVYKVTLPDKSSFTSNIPEGMRTDGSVRLKMDKGAVYSLYCNDEPVEYVSGGDIMTKGRYRLDINGISWFFEIGSLNVNDSLYCAPMGMQITRAGYNGELIPVVDGHYLRMDKDGTYNITFTGTEDESLNMDITKDSITPAVTVLIKGGVADITYSSDDIETVEMLKDGEPMENSYVRRVDSPGDYVLTAVDKAGNQTVKSFHLNYVLNMYAIIAVVLLFGLLAAGIIFTKRIKKQLTV
ncbi:MAG: hypothetical protein RSC13_01895 [Clostridium sp.]